MSRRTVLIATVAAGAYSTFLFEHLLSPDLDGVHGYVSELSAWDQPFHLVYSAGDLVTGVLSIIVAVTALRVLQRRPWAVAGWCCLLVFGVWAIGDAIFPLDCAPSLETTCALRERSGHVSFAHNFHSVTSIMAVTFGVLAMFALSMAGRRYGWWPALARLGWLLAMAEAVTGLGTLVLVFVGSWLGLVQRIQITILCLGLLVIAWALFADRVRAARTTTRPPPTSLEKTAP